MDASGAKIFRYLNPIPTKGGRFCPPSQRSQLTFFRGYVPEVDYESIFVSDNSDDPLERRFNVTQSVARQPVEGTFGRSKNKWRILLRGGGGMR